MAKFNRFRKSSATAHEHFDGRHRFEHWYRDNTVYFITARCRDKYPAFASEAAKAVFWERFHYYTKKYEFVPWATTFDVQPLSHSWLQQILR